MILAYTILLAINVWSYMHQLEPDGNRILAIISAVGIGASLHGIVTSVARRRAKKGTWGE